MIFSRRFVHLDGERNIALSRAERLHKVQHQARQGCFARSYVRSKFAGRNVAFAEQRTMQEASAARINALVVRFERQMLVHFKKPRAAVRQGVDRQGSTRNDLVDRLHKRVPWARAIHLTLSFVSV